MKNNNLNYETQLGIVIRVTIQKDTQDVLLETKSQQVMKNSYLIGSCAGNRIIEISLKRLSESDFFEQAIHSITEQYKLSLERCETHDELECRKAKYGIDIPSNRHENKIQEQLDALSEIPADIVFAAIGIIRATVAELNKIESNEFVIENMPIE